MLRRLERVIDEMPGKPRLEDDHPMRTVTRQVAFEPTGWTPERAEKVGSLFDQLAPGWHARDELRRRDPVDDALARGGPFPSGPWLELGSGVGLFTAALAESAAANDGAVTAVDLSFEMLTRAPADPPRVRADANRLPFADATFGTVWLINMLLFPQEVARVLGDGGVVVWVNILGDATPIHLSADDVARALPGDWEGVHADAGWGTWASLRRA